jgi:hypothetical protein
LVNNNKKIKPLWIQITEEGVYPLESRRENTTEGMTTFWLYDWPSYLLIGAQQKPTTKFLGNLSHHEVYLKRALARFMRG